MNRFRERLYALHEPALLPECVGRTLHGDAFEVLPFLPHQSVDLLIIDPPYNLTKTFGHTTFTKRSTASYEDWVHSWLVLLVPLLKSTASIYVCSEWRSSGIVQRILEDYFIVKNRITWEREKGRGSSRNWKNCSEDIWFCVLGEDYYFDVEAVKLKRRVIAPYRDETGTPRGWSADGDGDFRLTHPSNLWTDISVPFWSMTENTDHPTQKPEKLIAKLVLASSRPGDVVLDPFLGSGTTSVVAKKLGRQFIGIEKEEVFCLLAEKRLEMADRGPNIQGYSSGYFWERNTLAFQQDNNTRSNPGSNGQTSLFEHES